MADAVMVAVVAVAVVAIAMVVITPAPVTPALPVTVAVTVVPVAVIAVLAVMMIRAAIAALLGQRRTGARKGGGGKDDRDETVHGCFLPVLFARTLTVAWPPRVDAYQALAFEARLRRGGHFKIVTRRLSVDRCQGRSLSDVVQPCRRPKDREHSRRFMMRRATLAILAAAGAIAIASPVLAQPDNHDHGWRPGYDRGREDGPRGGPRGGPRSYDLDQRIDWLQRRIDRGRDDGSLDRREIYRVQGALDDIRRDKRRMERNNYGHLRGYQRDELQSRLDRVNDQIRWLRRNDDARPW